ncbi:hypothetical protein BC941DRAFT_4011 [Chlamydoabsidia padenii]|nr:hypothetical protein BC941DRAFT_4011 [Chlamydoabsidia padenii]
MSYRNDSSIQQRSRKNTPDNTDLDDLDYLDKDQFIVDEETLLGNNTTSNTPVPKMSSLYHQRKQLFGMHWNSNKLHWIFLALAMALLLLLIKIFTFVNNALFFSTDRQTEIQKENYYNGTHYFGNTTILISLDGLRNDYLKRGVTPHLKNFGK